MDDICSAGQTLAAQDLCPRLSPRTKRPYKPRYINSAILALRMAWQWAIDSEGLGLASNPFRKVKLLPEQGRQELRRRS